MMEIVTRKPDYEGKADHKIAGSPHLLEVSAATNAIT